MVHALSATPPFAELAVWRRATTGMPFPHDEACTSRPGPAFRQDLTNPLQLSRAREERASTIFRGLFTIGPPFGLARSSEHLAWG